MVAYPLKMELMTVHSINPGKTSALLPEVKLILSSEMAYNNWTSGCLNYDSEIATHVKLRMLVELFTTITLVPILMCSNCGPCPKVKTCGLDWNDWRMALRLNSSYVVELYRDPFCGNSKCGTLKRKVRNAALDPIRIYLDKDVFTWQNSTYVSGRKGSLLRLFVGGIRNSVSYVRPKGLLPVKRLKQFEITSVAPFKLESIAIGLES